MNREELLSYVRRWLKEEVAAESFWGDPELLTYLDRGYGQVCVEAELLQCTSTANSVVGAREYAFPPDTLRVIRVFYNNVKLIPRTIAELDLEDPEWYVLPNGTPEKWATRGQLYHLIPPADAAGQDNLKLWCIQCPPELLTGAEPEIPECYHEAIALGAILRALKADRTAPENQVAIRQAQADYDRAIIVAKAQHARKQLPTRVRTVQDFYQTATGWR